MDFRLHFPSMLGGIIVTQQRCLQVIIHIQGQIPSLVATLYVVQILLHRKVADLQRLASLFPSPKLRRAGELVKLILLVVQTRQQPKAQTPLPQTPAPSKGGQDRFTTWESALQKSRKSQSKMWIVRVDFPRENRRRLSLPKHLKHQSLGTDRTMTTKMKTLIRLSHVKRKCRRVETKSTWNFRTIPMRRRD